MRRYGIPDSYEQLKELTRGKGGITKETLHGFIERLDLPSDEKNRLRALTPQNYIGEAVTLSKEIEAESKVNP
jgi:adenylosuccinate lyase